jgi:hypothetical protein
MLSGLRKDMHIESDRIIGELLGDCQGIIGRQVIDSDAVARKTSS